MKRINAEKVHVDKLWPREQQAPKPEIGSWSDLDKAAGNDHVIIELHRSQLISNDEVRQWAGFQLSLLRLLSRFFMTCHDMKPGAPSVRCLQTKSVVLGREYGHGEFWL